MGLGKWLKKKAKQAARAVETAVDKAGEAVSDVLETVGNKTSDNIKAAGNWAERNLGYPGELIQEASAWLGDAVASGTTLAASAIKSGLSLLGHSIGSTLLIIGGIVTGDGDMIKAGFQDMVFSIKGSALILVGGTIHAFNTTLAGERTRALHADEKEVLRNVFRRSIAYYNVRIATGRGGFFRVLLDQSGIDPRPFTLGNIMYFFNNRIDNDVLVHECTHVWQYQHEGPGYAADSRWTELEKGETRTYNWRREIRAGRDHWTEMNAEAQAELIDDVWEYGDVIVTESSPIRIVASGKGVFFTDPEKGNQRRFEFRSGPEWNGRTDHTALASEAMETIRDAGSARLSALLD